MTKAATVRDVAKLARTSVASVSRFLNAPNVISEDLRLRIMQAIEETKYVLNPTARSLSTSVTNGIGLASLLRDPDRYASLVLSIIREVNSRGLMAMVQIEEQPAALTVDRLRALRSSVDQLIILADRHGGAQLVRNVTGVSGIVAYLSVSHRVAQGDAARASSIVEFAVDSSGGDALVSMIEPAGANGRTTRKAVPL